MSRTVKQILRLTLLGAVILLLLLSPLMFRWRRGNDLEIRMLDVGQGDCMLLRAPSGDILIDAGSESTQECLAIRLRELEVDSLLLAVFTHADEDHLGGADAVLDTVKVERIWINGSDEKNDSVRAFYAAVERTGTPVEIVSAGDEAVFGALKLTVLAPFSKTVAQGNEGSIVLRMTYGNITMLSMGDAGIKEEQTLLSQYGKLYMDCDILKVGHHGSYTSSGLYFLKTVTPTYALISCAEGNAYGHPHGSVLEDLEQVGATVLRTDRTGELCLITDGETIKQKETHTVFGGFS